MYAHSTRESVKLPNVLNRHLCNVGSAQPLRSKARIHLQNIYHINFDNVPDRAGFVFVCDILIRVIYARSVVDSKVFHAINLYPAAYLVAIAYSE